MGGVERREISQSVENNGVCLRWCTSGVMDKMSRRIPSPYSTPKIFNWVQLKAEQLVLQRSISPLLGGRHDGEDFCPVARDVCRASSPWRAEGQQKGRRAIIQCAQLQQGRLQTVPRRGMIP